MSQSRTFFYAAVGERLTAHAVDVEGARLVRGESATLPAWVQYVWPHPARPLVYVVSSNGGPTGGAGDTHHASALAVDPGSGTLTPHGEPVELPSRPIHCTVDHSGRYLLVAYNRPSGITVHELREDGSVGGAIEQPPDLDVGIFAHQVRVTPSNRTAILVARGNDAAEGRGEDPGALKLFDFADGRLASRGSVAPGDGLGYGFGPRHLDFHPNRRWVLVSLERQDQLQVYELTPDDLLSPAPLHTVDSLADPARRLGPQLACAVHVHPNGRFVYQSNRTDGLRRDEGWAVARGGEDSLVVYALDPATGEPTVVQRMHTGSIHVRTFSIDPSGRLLIAATIRPVPVRTPDGGVRLVPAALLLYRIGGDGRLTPARSYEVDTRGLLMFWTGLFTVPA